MLIISILPPLEESYVPRLENWVIIANFVQFQSAQTWFLRSEIL